MLIYLQFNRKTTFGYDLCMNVWEWIWHFHWNFVKLKCAAETNVACSPPWPHAQNIGYASRIVAKILLFGCKIWIFFFNIILFSILLSQYDTLICIQHQHQQIERVSPLHHYIVISHLYPLDFQWEWKRLFCSIVRNVTFWYAFSPPFSNIQMNSGSFGKRTLARSFDSN